MAWGLSATLGCFAVAVNDGNILLPPGASLLNPVVWIDASREVPAARAAVIIVGTVLTVGIGWFVRLAAQPRTTRAALGAAATVGLLATLVAFSILGTGITASIGKMAHLGALGIHPVEDREDFGEKMTQAEEQYLAQYLPPELQHADAPTRQYTLQSLWRKAVSTNQLHAGIIAGWVILLVVGAFLMTLSLSGTWAADYLARSGRGLAARASCYLELYLPTVGLVLWFLGAFVLVVVISTTSTNIKGGPPWATVVLVGVFGGGLVGLAHTGVIRQWHPLIRVGLYFGWMGCATGAGLLAGWL